MYMPINSLGYSCIKKLQKDNLWHAYNEPINFYSEQKTKEEKERTFFCQMIIKATSTPCLTRIRLTRISLARLLKRFPFLILTRVMKIRGKSKIRLTRYFPYFHTTKCSNKLVTPKNIVFVPFSN